MLSERNYEELAKYKDGPLPAPKNRSERMQYLIDEKYIDGVEYDNVCPSEWEIDIIVTKWGITELGKDALAEFEDNRAKEAQQKSEKKFDRIFQIFLIIFGAVIGIIFDNIFGIADFVKSIFAR